MLVLLISRIKGWRFIPYFKMSGDLSVKKTMTVKDHKNDKLQYFTVRLTVSYI